MTRRSLRIKQKDEASSGKLQMQDDPVSTETSKRARGESEDDNSEYQDQEEEEESLNKARKGSKKKTRTKVDFCEDDQRAKSRAKKSKKRMPEQFRKVRGKLGMLETMAKDIPLDVIFEIFCYLDPDDLLRLARTSKDLRGILMSKSSESIWRISRGNVQDLPPLPLDLNEPQYAHLLYESYCYVCNSRARCNNVFWSFRMRCCKNCAADTFPEFFDAQFRDVLPADLVGYESRILPREHAQGSSKWPPVEFGNLQIAAQIKAEFEALQTPEDRSAWITRKTQERQTIDAHGRQCEAWHRARLYKRTDELGDIRKQRKIAILERLDEIGWREEAEKIMRHYRDEFSNHKLVKQPRKLTEHGWRSIETELVPMLSEHKTKRLAEERRQILVQRYDRLKTEYEGIRSASDLREPFPTVGDILTNKVFENSIWDTPVDQVLTNVFFQEKLSEHLPRIISEWRPAKVQELVEIMQKSNPAASADDLHLATTVFHCTSCSARTRMYYPQMFYHFCCSSNPPTDSVSAERVKMYSSGKAFTCGQWKAECIVLSDIGSQIAQTILEGCSLDPATATVQALNAANPLIECITCYKGSTWYQSGRAFMRWPLALAHSASQHTLAINAFGESTEFILARESGRNWIQNIHCSYCHILLSFRGLVDHFKAHHSDSVDVEKPEAIQERWYWDPRLSLRELGEEFRCTPPVSPAVAPVDESAAHTHASTDIIATGTSTAQP